MRVTAKMKQNILNVIMAGALLFLLGSPLQAASETLFTTQAPVLTGMSDGTNVNYELGAELRSNIAGQITAIRFWKDANETGVHTGRIWSASGQVLATVTFATETASGWQQQALAAPLTIAANTAYVVTVNTGSTYYVATNYGLASQITNGNLSNVVGNNGLYGAAGSFPTNSWEASNYFRDVVFVPSTISSGSSTGSTGGTTTTGTAPAITTQPASQAVAVGQSATFSAVASGTGPLTYQWMKNTVPISGATSASYTTPSETRSDSGSLFTVTVSNSVGSTTSNAATLTIKKWSSSTTTSVAPTISTQPSSSTVTAGQTATFNVASTGTAPMSFQWKKNGSAVSGATSSSYTTPPAATSDNGSQFTVTVSNSMGNATSNPATLSVTSAAVAPAISTQPSSKSVTAGQTATFTVAATGTSPMTYQWKKNGTAISGANSASYTTPAETTADNNAQFAVTISNSAGTANSNSAILTVNSGTLVLNSSASSLAFGSVNISSTSTKTVTLTNAGTSTVTISGMTVSGAGFNASGVPTGLILTPGQTATLTATFTPSTAATLTGSVSVASNASNSPDTISLSGTGVTVVNHSAALSWKASTSTVMGYNTYSSTTSGGPYTKLTSTPVASTTYTDSNVKSGTTYYFVVTSVASNGAESSYSSETSATIP